MLSVNVNLAAAKPSVEEIAQQDDAHPNDVRISGYSDQILRFIAERGDGNGLLTFVENIDVLYDLEAKLKAAECKDDGLLARLDSQEAEEQQPRPKRALDRNVSTEPVR